MFSQSRLIRLTLYPYAILLQTIPIVAIAPIVLVSLGRILQYQSDCMPDQSVSDHHEYDNRTDAGGSRAARSVQTLSRNSLADFYSTSDPHMHALLISGIRIASGASIVGAIVGEFFVGSSQPGLGAIIQQKDPFTLPDLYAAVFVSALLGSSMFAVVSLVGEFVLRRWFGMSLTQQTSGRKGSD